MTEPIEEIEADYEIVDYPGSAASCTCERCVGACKHKPGWFKPGEVELLAKYMNLSLEELFRDYLTVEWWASDEPIYVVSPGIVGLPTGQQVPYIRTGRCVFLTEDDRCRIHAAKPAECALFWHGMDTVTGGFDEHREVAMLWSGEPQKQIAALLRHEPDAVPLLKHWLSRMLESFMEDLKVTATDGQQVTIGFPPVQIGTVRHHENCDAVLSTSDLIAGIEQKPCNCGAASRILPEVTKLEMHP